MNNHLKVKKMTLVLSVSLVVLIIIGINVVSAQAKEVSTKDGWTQTSMSVNVASSKTKYHYNFDSVGGSCHKTGVYPSDAEHSFSGTYQSGSQRIRARGTNNHDQTIRIYYEYRFIE